jgi:hypothetical protein
METNKNAQNAQNEKHVYYDTSSKNQNNFVDERDHNYGKTNSTNENAQIAQNAHPTFECKCCIYKTNKKSDYNRHLCSNKHNKKFSLSLKHNNNLQKQKNTFECEHCNKCYQHSSSLSKHKKTCNLSDSAITKLEIDETNPINKLVLKIVEENSNLVNKIANDSTELHNILKEIIKNGIITNSQINTNINSNNTNSNNTFNLQVYLNETCKDAMNLSEFVNKIVPTIEELEKTAREGYVKGVTSIVNTRLDKVDKNNQPIHCTDGKREVLYIKENDVWNKEDGDNKPLLLKAIKTVAHKNICNISEWRKMYPDCTSSESRKNDLYLKITLNAMSGGTEEECNENYNKIISAIAKHTIIEK